MRAGCVSNGLRRLSNPHSRWALWQYVSCLARGAIWRPWPVLIVPETLDRSGITLLAGLAACGPVHLRGRTMCRAPRRAFHRASGRAGVETDVAFALVMRRCGCIGLRSAPWFLMWVRECVRAFPVWPAYLAVDARPHWPPLCSAAAWCRGSRWGAGPPAMPMLVWRLLGAGAGADDPGVVLASSCMTSGRFPHRAAMAPDGRIFARPG